MLLKNYIIEDIQKYECCYYKKNIDKYQGDPTTS